ncbi:LysR family transcriptional regulator [Cupriavidus sp. UYPR2.512]|uniref:helix-turn-helix domain-containing protein n=1 Tax=Cupriavidus sp. UYPR2.512 TaxID=1080187 RepID=UPI00035EDBB1|nr:LysR family transcriptional regulator [Cupriavidus sp. UYPR2.512]UIF90847.1 LysR family transcriptional regulator [Cupriavidus necator]
MIDDRLREWATPRQLEYLEAILKHGSGTKAARALGVGKTAVNDSMVALRKRAAKAGYSPEHAMTRTVPDGFMVKGVSTYYDEEGKPRGQWVKSAQDPERFEQIMRDFAATMAEGVKGLAPITKPPKVADEDLLCVYPQGDPHFGMYAWWQDAGEDFDLSIAERLTCSAVDRLVASAPPAKTALLLNLGDAFHADNQKNQSQSGHQLDVDGRWAKVQQVGLRAMLYCVRRLLERHQKVVVRVNRGNHDGHSSYALALMLSCYFHDEPRVEVDLSPAVAWYYRFGKVLIGSTHGDTIKGADMVSLMAADRPQDWGETGHRYWYVGHVHHQDSKEYRGGVVEYFRTLAARDAWHAGQGYRAGRDMRLIVHHREHGEIERHRCDVGMLSEGAA